MTRRAKLARRVAGISILSFSLLYVTSYGASPNASLSDKHSKKQDKNDVVYVCACLNTRSCSCMTMAKTGGVCACGPKGGPPLKAVPRDGEWAKENRQALAN
jgi:hypothetical protein